MISLLVVSLIYYAILFAYRKEVTKWDAIGLVLLMASLIITVF